MTRLRQDTGIRGEQIALDFLLGLGYQLVAKNWRCRSGEIDLIMMDGNIMVFVEVKARRGSGYGLPQEAVGSKKQAKIRRLAQYYSDGCQTRRAGSALRCGGDHFPGRSGAADRASAGGVLDQV